VYVIFEKGKTMNKIDWKKVWDKFDEWYSENFDPEWEEQKEKIKDLVNGELEDKRE